MSHKYLRPVVLRTHVDVGEEHAHWDGPSEKEDRREIIEELKRT